MSVIPDLAHAAALIAEPARAAMLSALLDDIALPAGELARLARVTPQTASAHLSKLVSGGLLSVTTTGRHRYFRLKNKDVARVLESLALIAPTPVPRGLSDSLERKAIFRARTCYDHLAGELGVKLTQAFIEKGLLQQHAEAYEVTDMGEAWLNTFGIDCPQLRGKHRMFARVCPDWSERKSHIAGALGAEIANQLFGLRWIVRKSGSRVVKVTDLGRNQLKREFGLEWAESNSLNSSR
ncbi:MAG: ArsR family transcriptional regulator [Chloroflexi bacterium]|nr:MAG: ArsR family transcriptional regulator [Chloroflexota bacterium]